MSGVEVETKNNDIYFKIERPMFELLVAGKEVIIEQSDGTSLHFILEDMGFDQMGLAVTKAIEACPEFTSSAHLDMQDRLGRKLP